MKANNPRIRTLCYWAFASGLAALLALSGCKSRDGDNVGRGSDPLLGGPGRIPPQNVPVPGRAGNGKTDPLLGSPAGRTGVGYSDDPERFKGIYIPGAGSTPAALAGKMKDGDELKIDGKDVRVPLVQTGGIVPLAAVEPGSGLEPLFAELEKYGVKKEDRLLGREDGKYVFRASIPSNFGGKRQYSGIGTTPSEAVKHVLEQVMIDRK